MQKRFDYLDSLRAVAVLAVLLHHLSLYEHFSGLFPFFIDFGKFGVDLFFFLSGYLFSKKYCDHQTQVSNNSVANYMLNRFIRLYPLYLLAVLIFIVYVKLFTEIDLALRSIMLLVFMLTGLATIYLPADEVPFLITWSITSELFCYLVFFITTFHQDTQNRKRILFILFVLFHIIKIVMVSTDINNWSLMFFTRIDTFFLGTLIAIVSYRLSITLIITFLFIDYSIGVLENPYVFVPLIIIPIIFSIVKFVNNKMTVKIFSNIGVSSYFIYLFHMMYIQIIGMLMNYGNALYNLHNSFFVSFLLILASSHITGLFVMKYYERPLQSFIRILLFDKTTGTQ